MRNRRTKRQVSLFLICLMFAMVLVGCGMTPTKTTENDKYTPTDENLTVVGVSQLGSESVWRTANTTSIQKAFTKEKGYFLLFDNARQKKENQMKAIRNFISQRVDYIVFSPITESGWTTVLREAKDAGIPVILMDRTIDVGDPSLYTTLVGSDFTEEGKKAGEWLEEYLAGIKFNDDQVNVVVLQGTEGASATIGRTKGFEMVAAEHPEWKILEQVDADFTTAKGKEAMRGLLRKYPDIDVVVSQNDDMTFGAIEAINEAGKTTGTGGDIAIISFDAVKDALEKVKAGVINVDIECNPNQGAYIEKVIQALERGEEVDKAYYVEERVFTQKNVLSVLNDWPY